MNSFISLMKKITLLAFILFVSCSVKPNISDSTNLIKISLPTMQCNMCVATIENSLNKIDGVIKYKVKIEDLNVTIKYHIR